MTSPLSNWLTGFSRQRQNHLEDFKTISIGTDVSDPHPPSGNSAKKTGKFGPGARSKLVTNAFENYNMSRPKLLVELENFILTRLNALSDGQAQMGKMNKEGDKDFCSDRLLIYKEAFQLYIDECNIYRPILAAVKHEYEAALMHEKNEVEKFSSLKVTSAIKEHEYQEQLKETESVHADQVKSLISHRINAQKELQRVTKENHQIRIINKNLEDKYNSLVQENIEIKSQVKSLTKGIGRMEEEKILLLEKDDNRRHENLSLKSAAQKSFDEIDRLRQVYTNTQPKTTTVVVQYKSTWIATQLNSIK